VLCFWRLIDRLSPQMRGFCPSSVHVRFALDKVAMRQISLRLIRFPRHYHATSAPHSTTSTCLSYQKNKRLEPGNLPKSDAVSTIDERWVQNTFTQVFIRVLAFSFALYCEAPAIPCPKQHCCSVHHPSL